MGNVAYDTLAYATGAFCAKGRAGWSQEMEEGFRHSRLNTCTFMQRSFSLRSCIAFPGEPAGSPFLAGSPPWTWPRHGQSLQIPKVPHVTSNTRLVLA